MCLDGSEHVPPAIEYALALRECQANCIYLRLIMICHKYRRGDPRAPRLDQIQKNSIVGCMPLDDSIQAIGMPSRIIKRKITNTC
jgi:hypothetical protein